MNPIRYVTLDPTGNITCLVLDEVEEDDRARVTSALMSRCEQVGYLQKPHNSAAVARLQMMGGEFCGNASMAAASFIAREAGCKEKTEIQLEVSGAKGVLSCTVTPLSDDVWEGTVAMPPVLEMMSFRLNEYNMVLVRLEGIAHLILPDHSVDRSEAEALIRSAARILPDPSVGLLQWNSRTKYMKPLVFVRKSDTLVWETGCGSGSTAIGAWLASSHENGVFRPEIHQPGGTILAEIHQADGKAEGVRITGHVKIGMTETLFPDGD